MDDFLDEVVDASEGATTGCLLGDETEPALGLVQPRRIGRRVVDVEAGRLCEPESYPGMLVGRVVVDDQMDIEMAGFSLIDALEELKKLLVTMAWLTLREHHSGCDVERGE